MGAVMIDRYGIAKDFAGPLATALAASTAAAITSLRGYMLDT